MMRLRIVVAAAALALAALPALADPGPAPSAPAVTSPAAEDAPKSSEPPAEAPAAAAVQPVAPPPPPTLTVKVDLTGQKMTVLEHGAPKYTWLISSGLAAYATPTGSFRPIRMEKMWYSRKYDLAPMPNAVFFHKGFAIHGTQATGALGRPASHGCVRLAPGNAATFYKLVQKHGLARTRISLNGSPRYRDPAIAAHKLQQAPRTAGFTPGFFTYSSFDNPYSYYPARKGQRTKRARTYLSQGYTASGYPVRQR